MHQKIYSVYILSNFERTVFYTGVTSDLTRRVREHFFKANSSFTSKYKCFDLLSFEDYYDVKNAIAREKQIKRWKRDWKLKLIKKLNPNLIDLAKDWKK